MSSQGRRQSPSQAHSWSQVQIQVIVKVKVSAVCRKMSDLSLRKLFKEGFYKKLELDKLCRVCSPLVRFCLHIWECKFHLPTGLASFLSTCFGRGTRESNTSRYYMSQQRFKTSFKNFSLLMNWSGVSGSRLMAKLGWVEEVLPSRWLGVRGSIQPSAFVRLVCWK